MKIISIILIILVSYNLQVLSNRIVIGLISEGENSDIRKIFAKALENANTHSEKNYGGIIANVSSHGNILESSKELCKMLGKGVGGIFSLTARNSASHMMNICDAKEVPFIDIRMDSKEMSSSINLHPNPRHIAQALHDVIDAYDWSSFTFLYESSQDLVILYELMDLYMHDGPAITVRKYDFQLYGNYRNVLHKIRKSRDNSIVIVGSIETLPELLRQAQQTGIITEQYQYIISNLDFHSINLDQYKHSEANITGFRMISPENEQVTKLISALGYPEEIVDRNISCPITMDMALLYDGIQLYAESTKILKQLPVPLDCAKNNQWNSGFTLNNYISLSSAEGLTGKISFDLGQRTDYALELIELTTSGITKFGEWNTKGEVVLERIVAPVSTIEKDELSLVNKTFVVLIAMSEPHGMLKVATNQLSGNNRYEGFGIDLIQKLAEILGFNYTFQMHIDDNYGTFNIQTNTSTGMIREVIENRADLAITDLTITSEREAGVDFTIPFMNLGISILYKKPQKEAPKLFSFMDPFSKGVWLWLGLTYIVISLSFFVLGRLTPAEWDNPYPCIQNPVELENQFSFGNSFWFTIGTLLQQGSELAARAPATRTLASFWSFFTLIMVSSYTANLAACLTVESLSSPIENVNDLALNKGGVIYGAKKSGSTRNFFLNANETDSDIVSVYKKMNDYMISNPNLLMDTNLEGVERVENENYAFLMESTSIEYNVQRRCNLTQIGGVLDEKGYGIAMRKNWPYRDKLNHALLELQEAGVLTKMKLKWWNEVGTGGCTSKTDQSSAAELGMPNLGGVYFVLLIGSILAGIIGILDWLFNVYRRSLNSKLSFKQELKDEIKFVSDCANTTTVIRTHEVFSSRHSSLINEL